MKTKRNCPNCNVEMRHITTKSHYNTQIVLDQCEICGGIWVDAHELHKINHNEIAQLKELDKEINDDIKKDVVIKTDLVCPKDDTPLIQPKQAMFPNGSGITVEMCPTCLGVWFNYGEFIKHQLHKAEVARRKKEKPTVEEETRTIKNVKKLLEKERSNTPDKIKIFGTYLSRPIKRNTAGNIPNSLPALLLTLGDAVNKSVRGSALFDSGKTPESIIPATQKHTYDFSAIHELNARYHKRRYDIMSIAILLLILFVSGTVTYFDHRKDEKMQDYGFCSMQCRNFSGSPLDPNSVTPEEAAICYAECSEEHDISHREYSQWRMENDVPWF